MKFYPTRGIPWFRIHVVLLNDPGRLLSVHIHHTSLVSGWAGAMALYEQMIVDFTDPIFNPYWRQGCYVFPFMSRIGVIESVNGWCLGVWFRTDQVVLVSDGMLVC